MSLRPIFQAKINYTIFEDIILFSYYSYNFIVIIFYNYNLQLYL